MVPTTPIAITTMNNEHPTKAATLGPVDRRAGIEEDAAMGCGCPQPGHAWACRETARLQARHSAIVLLGPIKTLHGKATISNKAPKSHQPTKNRPLLCAIKAGSKPNKRASIKYSKVPLLAQRLAGKRAAARARRPGVRELP
jgi:hypothetical protein